MSVIRNIWKSFAEKYPSLSEWVREFGLFAFVSNFITLFKYLVLTFLPDYLTVLHSGDFGFPGERVELFGIRFKWYIIGYAEEHGGLRYFVAYMIAMSIAEAVNFLIQRKYVFRSKGNIVRQAKWYLAAFIVVTLIVNSLNSVWTAVASHYMPKEVYNVVTTIFNGLVSMSVFFYVNKNVFADVNEEKYERNK